jgi:hypothetical protein
MCFSLQVRWHPVPSPEDSLQNKRKQISLQGFPSADRKSRPCRTQAQVQRHCPGAVFKNMKRTCKNHKERKTTNVTSHKPQGDAQTTARPDISASQRSCRSLGRLGDKAKRREARREQTTSRRATGNLEPCNPQPCSLRAATHV